MAGSNPLGSVLRPQVGYRCDPRYLPGPQAVDPLQQFTAAHRINQAAGLPLSSMPRQYQMQSVPFNTQQNIYNSRLAHQFPNGFNPASAPMVPSPLPRPERVANVKANGFDFDAEWAFCSQSQGGPSGQGAAPRKSSALTASPHSQPAVSRKRRLQDDASEDANKGKAPWRKYGQKSLKGKNYTGMKMMRCYYRCNFAGCCVKKEVDSSVWLNDVVKVTVNGEHSHPVTAAEKEQIPEEQRAPDISIEPGAEMDQISPNIDLRFATRVVMRNFVVSDPTRADCPIIFASAGFKDLTGYSAAETMGKNCRFLQGKDTNTHAVCAVGKAIRERREIHVILLNYTKDGTPFWNFLHITPIMLENGKLHSIVGTQLHVDGVVDSEPDDCIHLGAAPELQNIGAAPEALKAEADQGTTAVPIPHEKEETNGNLLDIAIDLYANNTNKEDAYFVSQDTVPISETPQDDANDSSRREVDFSTQASSAI